MVKKRRPRSKFRKFNSKTHSKTSKSYKNSINPEQKINQRKQEEFRNLTGKEELVGRIKAEPPPSWKQRLSHRRNRIGRMKTRPFNSLMTLILTRNRSRRSSSSSSSRRRRRRSNARLPKWHFTKTPNFPIST